MISAKSALAQHVIDEHECGHRLDHGHSTWENAGIVSSAPGKFRVFEARADRGLLGHDRGGRFESDAENNVLSVTDSTLNATGTIAGCANFPVDHAKGVVMLAPGQFRSRKS